MMIVAPKEMSELMQNIYGSDQRASVKKTL
jgi:hypothetical protein